MIEAKRFFALEINGKTKSRIATTKRNGSMQVAKKMMVNSTLIMDDFYHPILCFD